MNLLNEIKKLRYLHVGSMPLRAGLRNYWFGEDMPCLRRVLVSPETRKLLRRALDWPLVWRAAASYLSKQEHTANPETCDACAGRDRYRKFVHKPKLDMRRQVVCAKCGVPLDMWSRNKKCGGLKAYVPPAPPKQRGPVVFPLNWD
jgi:hypothetical protein